MKPRDPMLPGSRSRRSPIVRTADDVHPSTRTDQQVRDAILAALLAGPLMKWKLREQLHEEETRIVRILNVLKREQRVKAVGKRLEKRAWALIDYVMPPTPVFKPDHTVVTETKKAAPKESWWTKHAGRDADRSAFRRDVAARDREMATSASWRRPKVAFESLS